MLLHLFTLNYNFHSTKSVPTPYHKKEAALCLKTKNSMNSKVQVIKKHYQQILGSGGWLGYYKGKFKEGNMHAHNTGYYRA